MHPHLQTELNQRNGSVEYTVLMNENCNNIQYNQRNGSVEYTVLMNENCNNIQYNQRNVSVEYTVLMNENCNNIQYIDKYDFKKYQVKNCLNFFSGESGELS